VSGSFRNLTLLMTNQCTKSVQNAFLRSFLTANRGYAGWHRIPLRRNGFNIVYRGHTRGTLTHIDVPVNDLKIDLLMSLRASR